MSPAHHRGGDAATLWDLTSPHRHLSSPLPLPGEAAARTFHPALFCPSAHKNHSSSVSSPFPPCCKRGLAVRGEESRGLCWVPKHLWDANPCKKPSPPTRGEGSGGRAAEKMSQSDNNELLGGCTPQFPCNLCKNMKKTHCNTSPLFCPALTPKFTKPNSPRFYFISPSHKETTKSMPEGADQRFSWQSPSQ